ncbi:MAG TPA: glycosyltransferase family 4 protein [Verrucomicrobiae bacterium]|nr:glycosyltransferase family 4 protein [Verrucomicrobiae bacterium]
MKIVFLAPFGIRPKGTVIARMLPLAVELQRLGDEVVIVAPPYTNPEDSGKTETLRGVRLVNMVLPKGGRAAAAPALAWRMHRSALAEKPDLIHLFKPKGYGGLAAMLHLALRRAQPLFVDTDDWEGKGGMNALHDYSSAERRLYDLQEQWIPKRAAGVTVASRELQAQVLGMGLPEEKVLYLPNGVEQKPAGDGAKVRQRLGIPPDAPVVLLYTRFFEFSQERLHRVFEELSRRVPGVRFLVVGKGRQGEEDLLLAAARAGGFADAVTMGGWLRVEEIPDHLAAADVAVYPLDDTVVNRAKCPAKLTEILLAGIPVVADRVGQAAEYVQHGVSGILTDPADPLEMVGETVRLLGDHELRRRLGEQASRHLLLNFSWRDAACRLHHFYRNAGRR